MIAPALIRATESGAKDYINSCPPLEADWKKLSVQEYQFHFERSTRLHVVD